jgi:Fe-S oxidoreductase/FAD/FMN-containing dehydrogenase
MKFNENLKTELVSVFKDRIIFDQNERMLYDHDVGNLPSMVSNWLKSTPDAVVFPVSREEVEFLVKFAEKHKIPLTPKGASSGGAGGSVPTRGGFVVDFLKMNRILNVDKKNFTATIEPGVIWNDLDNHLEKMNLSIRAYPTSKISATAAGWVAHDGVGVGSFAYGSIKENLLSAEIVTPSKTYDNLTGSDLDIICGTYGITGFITKLTVKIKPLEKIIPKAVLFSKLEEMCACMEDVAENVPVWSVHFATPSFIKLKQEAEGHRLLPADKYLALFALTESQLDKHEGKLKEIIASKGGTLTTQEISEEEWATRFYPMRVQKVGPTLISGEVVVPLKNLNKFLSTVDDKLTPTFLFGMEGTMANKTEVNVLAFAVDDERRGNFMYAWSFPLILLGMAKKLGGRTYVVGMYLSGEAKRYYGKERLKKIEQFKKENDPNNILNPGKVLEPTWKPYPVMKLGTVMKIGSAPMKFAAKVFANENPHIYSLLSERGDYDKMKDVKIKEYSEVDPKGIMNLWDIYSCSSCNYCSTVCPVYKEKGLESSSPRGKLYELKKIIEQKKTVVENGGNFYPSDKWVDSMFCTLCARCETVCQVNIQFHESWEKIREWMAKSEYGPPKNTVDMYNNIANDAFRNPFKEAYEKRNMWYKKKFQFPEKADTVYFIGCNTAYYEYQTLKNLLKIFTSAGLNFTTLGTDEKCCGAVNIMSGQNQNFEEIARYNVQQIKKRGAQRVVTGCPGCLRGLKKYKNVLGDEMDLEVVHSTQVLKELMDGGKIKFTKEFKPAKLPVIYHDPCEIGRVYEFEGKALFEEPRFILENVPGVGKALEFSTSKMDSYCCGGGGALKAVDYDLSAKISKRKVDDAILNEAKTIVSACPSCKKSTKVGVKLKKDDLKAQGQKLSMDVLDIADIIASAL